MPSSIFNPDADPETTTVDGRVSRDSVNEVFGTIRGGGGTGHNDSTGPVTFAAILASGTTNQYDTLDRAILLFDTSSLPAGATVTAATLEAYVTGKSNTLGNLETVVVGSTPASNTDLVNADYSQLGDTALSGTVAVDSLTTSAYNTWTLNAAGRAAITIGGITKLGFRMENDRANSAPSWVSSGNSGFAAETAENTNKPKLTVTYTTADGEQGWAIFM